MPKISVIVPVYKVEHYLDRCVASILKQTFVDFELILVDDGSPDRCPQMCDEWAKKDTRIQVIHKENGGLSSARNAGLDIMQGEYVSFVDSDDWLEPDALEYLYYLLKKYNADFSFAEMRRISDEGKTCPVNHGVETILTQDQFLLSFFKVGTQVNVQYAWGKLYKIRLFSEIKYCEGLTSEDIPAIFMIALNCNRIVHGSKIIYNYFIRADSLTQEEFGVRTFDLLKAWDIVCETAKLKNSHEWIIKLAYINRYRANMGVLYHFSLAPHYQRNWESYAKKIVCIRRQLVQGLPYLLKAKIPLSRKVMAVMLGGGFPISSRIINLLGKCRTLVKNLIKGY